MSTPTGRGPQVRLGRLAGVVVVALLAISLLVWVGTQTRDLGGPTAAGGTTAGPTSSTSGTPSASRGTPAASTDPESGLPVVALADLPTQAAQTVRLIDAGGPFPYSKDGSVFANAERRLPQHPRGYYTEYTVKTPGESDRGARRIIAGSGGQLYWTADHYASFRRIRR